MGVGHTLFPGYSSSLTLVRDNGISAGHFAKSAVTSGTAGERLDNSVRSMISFDHAITASSGLPLKFVWPGVGKYRLGYTLARQAVELLVKSNLIPAATERIGRQELLAARAEFSDGVAIGQADTSRYGRKVAGGWMNASLEDASVGVASLEDQSLVRPLLAGINSVRSQISHKQQIDAATVTTVMQLFDRANASLSDTIAGIEANATGGVSTNAAASGNRVLAQTESIMREALSAARAGTSTLPADSVFDQN